MFILYKIETEKKKKVGGVYVHSTTLHTEISVKQD